MKFSKKVSIAALLLLAVLLTQFAYSYWIGNVTLNANFGATNTLEISASNADEVIQFEWDWEHAASTKTPFAPVGYAKTGQSSVNYVLIPVKIKLEDLNNRKQDVVLKGISKDLGLELNSVIGKNNPEEDLNGKSVEGDDIPMFEIQYTVLDEAVTADKFAASFTDSTKLNKTMALENGSFYLLVEIKMSRAPQNEAHYTSVANQELKFVLTSTIK